MAQDILCCRSPEQGEHPHTLPSPWARAAGEGLESFCPYHAQKPFYFPLGDAQNHKPPGLGGV